MANEDLGFLNKELETFRGVVSHDTRSLVRRIASFREMPGRRCTENPDEKKAGTMRIAFGRQADRISALIVT